MTAERSIVGLFLTFFSLEFLVDFTLNELNLRHAAQHLAERGIPEPFQGKISPEGHRRSIEYALAYGRFERWARIYEAATTLLVLFGGLLPRLLDLAQTLGGRLPAWTRATGVLFLSALGLLFFILSQPASLYTTFVIEERFGFNKTSLKLYLTDTLKDLLLGAIAGAPIAYGLLWLMEAGGRHWWAWAILLLASYELLMTVLHPVLIAPLFNRFEPLAQGELRERIAELARRAGFAFSGIVTMDGSRRSGHSNAYFTGIGKTKRIVLYDTLIRQSSIEQNLAVLAHEMGHHRLQHVPKNLALHGAELCAGLYILSLLARYTPLFRAFGLEGPTPHAALALYGLLYSPFVFYTAPLFNLLSRAQERAADRFAARILGDAKPMEEALIQQAIKNLAILPPHPWFSAYYSSHPPVPERIVALRAAAADLRGT